jgi:membrane protein YqaA with SNARE-associated domain
MEQPENGYNRGDISFMLNQMSNNGTAEREASIGLRQLLIYVMAFGSYCLTLYVVGRTSEGGVTWSSLFLLYMSFANTFVPLPTNPVIIGLGRTYDPLLVGILGALGTAVANLSEYHVIAYLSARKFADKLKKRKIYLKMQEWYWQYPFLLLVLTNFLPIPVDPVRWLSIASGYSRLNFALATFVGRTPRYYLLALLGERYQVPNWILLLLIIIPALYTITKFALRKREAASKKV